MFGLIFSGTFLMYAVFMLGEGFDAPFLQIGFTTWTVRDLNYALITVFVAVMAMGNGYALSSGRAVRLLLSRTQERVLDQTTLTVVIGILAVLAVVFFIMFARDVDLGSYVHRIGAIRATEEFLGKGLYHIPMTVLMNMAVFLAMGLQRNKRLVVSLLFILAAVFNFLSAARLNMAILVVGTLAIKHAMQPFKFKMRYVFIAILIILFLGPVSLGLRGGYGEDKNISNWAEQLKFAISYYQDIDVFYFFAVIGMLGHANGMEAITAITSKLSSTGAYQYGQYLVPSLLLGFVPHAIWPNKPNYGTMLFNEYFWPGAVEDTGAMGSTTIGEVYWDFGIIGVGIAFFLFGYVMRGVEETRIRIGKNLWVAIFYALFAWFWAIYSNEILVGCFAQWLLYMIVWFAAYKLTTKAAREARPRGYLRTASIQD
ncbi:MAG: oligosaccharide repeat unit polymerase [Betaproteobacteria bacterium]|nr:MAG: oligosaccharide repeat unit polymerase [Betaproteobacteria bacterium]